MIVLPLCFFVFFCVFFGLCYAYVVFMLCVCVCACSFARLRLLCVCVLLRRSPMYPATGHPHGVAEGSYLRRLREAAPTRPEHRILRDCRHQGTGVVSRTG